MAIMFLFFCSFSKSTQAQTDSINTKITNEVKVLKVDAALANEKEVSEEVILPKNELGKKVSKQEKQKVKKSKRRRWNPFRNNRRTGCPVF